MKGFKAFLLRGNVLDLAVAVIVGGAFGNVMAALVKDLVTPLIGAVAKAPDFSAIRFELNGSAFLIGDFLNAALSFLLVATAVYFFIVLPMNAIVARQRRGEAPPDPSSKQCPECLNDVPVAAKRCGHCTSALPVG